MSIYRKYTSYNSLSTVLLYKIRNSNSPLCYIIITRSTLKNKKFHSKKEVFLNNKRIEFLTNAFY